MKSGGNMGGNAGEVQLSHDRTLWIIPEHGFTLCSPSRPLESALMAPSNPGNEIRRRVQIDRAPST
jgi:hypothetical protein